jgi:hypothetical protein
MRMSACKYCDLTVMCMSACKTLSSCITIKHCKWYAMHVNYSKPHTCMTNRQIHRAGQNHKYKVPIRLYVHKVPIRLYEYKVPIRSCIYKVPIRVFLHIQLFLPIRLFLQGLIAYTVIYGACRWFCPTLQVTQSITHLQHAHTHTLHTPCTHTPYAPAGHTHTHPAHPLHTHTPLRTSRAHTHTLHTPCTHTHPTHQQGTVL